MEYYSAVGRTELSTHIKELTIPKGYTLNDRRQISGWKYELEDRLVDGSRD